MKGSLFDLLYNPRGLYNISKEFFLVGITSAENHFQKEEIARGTDINTIKLTAVPATNLSFSLELSLKGIHLLKFQSIPKTHSLLKLFTTLPKDVQLSIQQNPHKAAYANYFIVGMSEEANRQFNKKISFETGDMNEVLNNLELQDQAFITFRYLFEIGLEQKLTWLNYKFMANMAHSTLEILGELIKQ